MTKAEWLKVAPLGLPVVPVRTYTISSSLVSTRLQDHHFRLGNLVSYYVMDS